MKLVANSFSSVTLHDIGQFDNCCTLTIEYLDKKLAIDIAPSDAAALGAALSFKAQELARVMDAR